MRAPTSSMDFLHLNPDAQYELAAIDDEYAKTLLTAAKLPVSERRVARRQAKLRRMHALSSLVARYSPPRDDIDRAMVGVLSGHRTRMDYDDETHEDNPCVVDMAHGYMPYD